MRLIDADALKNGLGINGTAGSCEGCKYNRLFRNTCEATTFARFCLEIDNAPTIEPRHGLLIPDATLPRKGCYHCMFREGNLCKFLPASVPVVECGARHERHKDCPLVEV